jgi:AbrB family looped-hinge helix DNA binding protein
MVGLQNLVQTVLVRPMNTELATITAKGQVTIPKAIREALELRQGDQLRWDLDDGGVRVRLVTPLDLTYLRGVEAGLEEWASPEDEQAFADL